MGIAASVDLYGLNFIINVFSYLYLVMAIMIIVYFLNHFMGLVLV